MYFWCKYAGGPNVSARRKGRRYCNSGYGRLKTKSRSQEGFFKEDARAGRRAGDERAADDFERGITSVVHGAIPAGCGARGIRKLVEGRDSAGGC